MASLRAVPPEFSSEYVLYPYLAYTVLIPFFRVRACKIFRDMDDSLSSYFAMKGLIDLRVANILAKQAYLNQMAAQEQATLAKLLSLKAGKLTTLAEAQEQKQTPSTFNDEDQAALVPFPASSERYTHKGYDPTLLPVVAARGVGPVAGLVPFFLRQSSIIDFIYVKR
jgi:hypothetical protein